jgi:hypothetical protein
MDEKKFYNEISRAYKMAMEAGSQIVESEENLKAAKKIEKVILSTLLEDFKFGLRSGLEKENIANAIRHRYNFSFGEYVQDGETVAAVCVSGEDNQTGNRGKIKMGLKRLESLIPSDLIDRVPNWGFVCKAEGKLLTWIADCKATVRKSTMERIEDQLADDVKPSKPAEVNVPPIMTNEKLLELIAERILDVDFADKLGALMSDDTVAIAV